MIPPRFYLPAEYAVRLLWPVYRDAIIAQTPDHSGRKPLKAHDMQLGGVLYKPEQVVKISGAVS